MGRHSKMAEWMENVEKSIARIMADKVYTSAEFKRERDTFNALCKDLERAEIKKWLAQILEILVAERAKDQRKSESASKKMTTHEEADKEVAALKEKYNKVKAVSDDWVKKVDTLLKEWTLLDTTVTELNSWVAKDKTVEGENQFSLEKMESTLGELKNIFKQKEKLVDGL